MRVKGQRNAPAAVERVNLNRIKQEMIRDNKDLVRYSTDVGLSDSGRHQKGFAVRGVEGNRVGVSIDGVNLPDSKKTRCTPVIALQQLASVYRPRTRAQHRHRKRRGLFQYRQRRTGRRCELPNPART